MAENINSALFASSKRRQFKDRAAKFGIASGGLMVLVALLLIFFYLLYVVMPIFEPAKVEPRPGFDSLVSGQTRVIGLEEQNEIGYQLSEQGELAFFRARDLPAGPAGELIERRQFELSAPVSAVASDAVRNAFIALGDEQGRGLAITPKFTVTFPDDVRTITPGVAFPMGESLLTLDPRGQAIKQLAVAIDSSSASIVSLTADGRLVLAYFEAEENFISGDIEWTPSHAEIPYQVKELDQILITPDQRYLFLRDDSQVEVWSLQDPDEPLMKEKLMPGERNARVTTLALLTGASSLLVGNSNGVISQWFEVNTDSGRKFTRIREFKMQGAITQMAPERARKSFMAVSDQGRIALFHATGESKLIEKQIGEQVALASISPRANAGFAVVDGKLTFMKIKNEHPDVTVSGLWSQVWYEGHDEPKYMWQSTSASDDAEPKLSLVPITFGTIKAAAYAMLFAVPIALAGAIYTAYFMTPKMRTYVKPTVEIMEALPTVILGFLAGLWLAPLVEENLPGVVMLLIMLPLSALLTAYAWHRVPEDLRNRVAEGWQALIMVPVVLFVGWVAFSLSPVVELWLFNGDARAYITNDLGITFDQRNSLIVGLAMGFAVIPTIFSIAEDAVFSVPRHLTNGSLALGATSWQTLTRVVLLTASPGIFSAIMMGLGRAVGETMIVLMATGNTPIMDWSMFQGLRTLSANIAVEMPESEVGSSHYRILFLSAFVLFVLTFLFNTVSEFVRQRLREKYSSM